MKKLEALWRYEPDVKVVYNNEDQIIADVLTIDDKLADERGYLISNAPEMLIALNLVAELFDTVCEDCEIAVNAKKFLESVIRKAQGEDTK